MPAEYSIADDEILALVRDIVEQHHEDLAEAHIGVLMRSIAPRSNGKRVMGKAKKVGPELQAIIPWDFILWFSEDTWQELDAHQRRALVDHELCHCRIVNEKIKMADHDITEFHVIIARYGFWWPMAEETKSVMQASLGLETLNGTVGPVQPDIFGQIGNLLDGERDAQDDMA